MAKQTKSILIGFLAGAAAGAIMGLLFAPDKGTMTRQRIKDSASKAGSDLKSNLDEKFEALRSSILEFMDKIKKRASREKEEFETSFNETMEAAAGTVNPK